MEVEPRKYRFRLLNGAVSRSKLRPIPTWLYIIDSETAFTLSLCDDVVGKTLEFDAIASDCGALQYTSENDFCH
jgi:hypothetical protein